MAVENVMIPVDRAFEILDETLAEWRLPAQTLPVNEALGRFLSVDQTSRLELPPFDRSAMDGFAIQKDDLRDEYRIVETIAAGQVSTKKIEPGTAVKIMTGAPVPPGGGRVIKVEDTQQEGDILRVLRFDEQTNIAPKGQDVRVGDVVLGAGVRLGALDISNLISCGIIEVQVFRRARMVILSTGDEIVDSPGELVPGKILNSNRPMLAGLAAESGIEVVGQGHVPDDRAATVEAISAGMEKADLVVLCGGVSAGEFDYVLQALSEAGLEVHFSRVAIMPGKPTVFASNRDKPVFGLPGNPVSVFLTFHLFVLRAVARLSGAPAGMRRFPMRLEAGFERRKVVRLQHVPCRVTSRGTLLPLEYHGSAHLTALTRADGFFLVPVKTARVEAGERVTFIPFPKGLR